MITIRHRTASGRLDSMWEFDPARGVVDLVLRLASAKPAAFTVKVCAPDRPRVWSHPIMRLDGESWRILPAIWVVAPGKPGEPSKLVPSECGGRAALPFPCELHAVIGAGSHVVITNAPANVDQEIMELSI